MVALDSQASRDDLQRGQDTRAQKDNYAVDSELDGEEILAETGRLRNKPPLQRAQEENNDSYVKSLRSEQTRS